MQNTTDGTRDRAKEGYFSSLQMCVKEVLDLDS